MVKERQTVVNHSFHGERFASHGVDLDVLPDLLRYRDLLVETAKELWRRNNPSRERLPSGFEESLALRFYEVKSNCATIPLEREVETQQSSQRSMFDEPDELYEAILLVNETIDAARNDRSLPATFPKLLLECFRDYGKTLRGDEWFELRPANTDKASRYDQTVSDRLVNRANQSYEATADVIGQVTMARVSKPRVAIEIEPGREISADFRPQDEDTITTALKHHLTAKLHVVGRGRFSAEGVLQQIVEVTSLQILEDGHYPYDATAMPIWQQFAEIMKDVPPDEIAKLPTDAASRLDFYIYGAPQGEQ